MPHILRDASGRIASVHRDPQPGSEAVPADHPELKGKSFNIAGVLVGNPDLKAEKSRNYSLGLVLEETGRTLTASPLLSSALAAASTVGSVSGRGSSDQRPVTSGGPDGRGSGPRASGRRP